MTAKLVREFPVVTARRLRSLRDGLPVLSVVDRAEFIVNTNFLCVPAGFVLAVPRVLDWILLRTHGPWREAAIVHACLYAQEVEIYKSQRWSRMVYVERVWADDAFYELMRFLNVPRWRRLLLWGLVRAFGWTYYQADPQSRT